ncbi:hypothetical protein OC835_007722, partial [Tilletia horrida]
YEMDSSCSNAMSNASTGASARKRQRLDEPEGSIGAEAGAAGQVFAIPELVREIASYLSRDRLDLLALGAVNKLFRKHVLPVWARHQDVPSHMAEKRVLLFGSRPELLAHVKYLRLQCKRTSRCPNPPLDMFVLLIGMLAGQTTDEPPLIDLCFQLRHIGRLKAALTPFPGLMQNIVSVSVSTHLASESAQWASDCMQLSLFIADVQVAARMGRKDGIAFFAYGEMDPSHQSLSKQPRLPPSTSYSIFRALSPSLRLLSLCIGKNDETEAIFSGIEFARLQYFAVHLFDNTNALELREFLNRHRRLEDVRIKILNPSNDLPLLQYGFKHLRHVETSGDFGLRSYTPELQPRKLRCATDQVFDQEALLSPDGVLKQPYPKLRSFSYTSYEDGPLFANLGRSVSQVQIVCISAWQGKKLLSSIASGFKANTAHDIGAALTCVDVTVPKQPLAVITTAFRHAFAADAMPQLTELRLYYDDQLSNASFASEGAEAWKQAARTNEVAGVMADFSQARSLRVLRLGDNSPFSFSDQIILVNRVFPPALEYFAWRDRMSKSPQYFRFLPSTTTQAPATYHNDTADASATCPPPKHGRLQQIPSIFKQQITRDGVWMRHYFNFERNYTVLDHIAETPRFSLT